MRSVIESEMPLIVAIQHSKSGMLSKFHFTCFEWIIHDKLFHSSSFNLKNLCAAGTEEGPILLISKLTQSIAPVCLLCVHKRKVTNILMSHQINTFLSVSSDGSIAGWHCSDGSCCFSYDQLVPPGEVKIVLCESNASMAWFWTLGESTSLVDLKRGTVVQKIDFVGISSFSILKRHSNIISNNYQKGENQNASALPPSYAIMAGINSMRTYQIDEKTNLLKCHKIEDVPFVLGQKRCITPNGIVIYKNSTIHIYLPNLDIPIYSENIHEMTDDDMIANISWRHFETLLIGSFKGFFKIYKILNQKTQNTQRINIQKVTTFSYQKCCIFSNVALNSDIGVVIFAASKNSSKSKSFYKKSSSNHSTVMCLSIEDQKVVKLAIPQIDKICCVPDSSSRIVIQAEQHSSTFQIFDWGLSTSISQPRDLDTKDDNNISIRSEDYINSVSKSFINSQKNQGIKPISSSEVRNYNLFCKQFPISQSVDFRPNISSTSSSFVFRERSIGNTTKTPYITAICSQNFNNLSSRLQIIVGASDGKLYFFWENNLLPFEVSEALISPIIAIVLIPIKFIKTSCLIAIGQDGSFCLFKWNKMSHRYISNNLPIISIGLIETQRLLVIQKSDNSFTVYSLNSPEPIAVMLIPPARTVTIWSAVSFSQPSGIQSTLSLQINGSSLFYSVLEVSKLKKSNYLKKTIPRPNTINSLHFNQTINTNSPTNIKTHSGTLLSAKSTSYHELNSNLISPEKTIKTDSNTNNEFQSLVNRYVDSNSSDSAQNSDSGNDFPSKTHTAHIIRNMPSNSSIDDIKNNTKAQSSTSTSDQEADANKFECLALEDISTASANFSDSLSKLNIKRTNSKKNSNKTTSKSNTTINDEAICDPISHTGKFTARDIKNIVSVILEMMTPSFNIDEINSSSATKFRTSNKSYRIDEGQDALSFVLVGHRNLPTFFYPMFKLSGPTVFETSPFNAALHYLSYKIMSTFLNLKRNTEKFEKENKFKICGFISILTQFLFIHDLEIQKISALTCNQIINWSTSGIVVPERVWNLLVASYIQYFDKNDVADYDKYLMAIMMVTHADLVSPVFHKIVFDFLLKMAKGRSPSNFLAFNILLSNFEFWASFIKNNDENNKNKSKNDTSEKTDDTRNNNNINTDNENKRGKKELMIFLLSTFFKYETDEKDLVQEKFNYVISNYFNAFCESIRFILSNFPNQNIASAICNICSEVAEEYSSIGPVGPLFIAFLADSFSQFQDIFYSNLNPMQKKFKNKIVNEEQIWLFATNDGYVYAFKNMKFFFKEQISDGPIIVISIGPGAMFAAAITKNDQSLIKIDLKTSLFLSFSKKRTVESKKIEIKEGFNLENMRIEWGTKNDCHVQYYIS